MLNEAHDEYKMNSPAKLLSLIALAATVLPSLFYFSSAIGHDTTKTTTLIATLVWFATTPLWMGRPSDIEPEEVVP